MNKIFLENNYNNLVRPFNKQNGMTNIYTELKLLQLDLVCTRLKMFLLLLKIKRQNLIILERKKSGNGNYSLV
jgi:hypothetical protein